MLSLLAPNQLKHWISVDFRQRLREYQDLAPAARRAWLSALRTRLVSGRDITELPTALPERPHVLFVCHGNIYRSPFARALLSRLLADHPRVRATVSSCGLLSTVDRPSPADAQAVASARGVDLSAHRSAQVTAERVAAADVIVLMDRRNEAMLRARFPHHQHKLVLLGAFDPLASDLCVTIPDPYGRGTQVLEACFSRIERSVSRLVDALEGRSYVRPRSGLRHSVRRAATARILAPLWSCFTSDAAAILMLHRFEDREMGVWGHSPEVLTSHLEFLRAERYHIIGLDELVSRVRAGKSLLPRTVAFTVDDGYADFARVGAPLFERYDVPVTLFITTQFVDGNHWQWYDAISYLCGTRTSADVTLELGPGPLHIRWRNPRERVLAVRRAVARMKSLPGDTVARYLTSLSEAMDVQLPATPPPRFAAIGWRDVSALSARGVRFGAHSKSHVILANEDVEVARREIVDSIEIVRRLAPNPSAVFAYPNGLPSDFGTREEHIVAATGCIGAVASTGGHCTSSNVRYRPYAISRIPYTEDLQAMRLSLLGVHRAKSLLQPEGDSLDPRVR